MAQAALDSSILSSFLPEPDLDPPTHIPPVENVGLDPHSEEYFQKLVTALDLETENYAHVDPGIMKQFKELIRKYSHSFIYQALSWVPSQVSIIIFQLEIPLQSIIYLTGKVPQNWQPLKMSYKRC